MLLSTMTYEQMYHEILKDTHELSAVLLKEEKIFRKVAQRAKLYPYGRIYQWKHPHSHNNYTFFFDVKRHSDWDKMIKTVIFTEYDTDDGKVTVAISMNELTIGINVLSSHFFKRYYERHLSINTQFAPKRKHDVRVEFFLRTTNYLPMGDKLASIKELQKDEPDLINEALLTTEGLLLCKRLKENPNILIYKTYVGLNELFERQYADVTLNVIHIYFLRAKDDSPRFTQTIERLYLDGINDMNKLWNDQDLPFDKKQNLRHHRLMDVLDDLSKFFI